MEIDMLAGQTQNPFRIQDFNDQDIFQVKVNGGLDPIPWTTTETEFTQTFVDEFYPLWHVSSPLTVITETAESGAGVYQFEYTVTTADINTGVDSKGLFNVRAYAPFIVVQLENTGLGSITSNLKVFNNDVQMISDNDLTVPSGDFVVFEYNDSGTPALGEFTDFEYDVGDVIGIKVWTDTTGDLRFNKIAILGIPAILQVDAVNFALGNADDWDTGNSEARPSFPTALSPTLESSLRHSQYRCGEPNSNVNDFGYTNECFSAFKGTKLYSIAFTNSMFNTPNDAMTWVKITDVWDTTGHLIITKWK
jgi:hypothetical protein